MRNKISNQILKEIKYTIWSGHLNNHFTFEYWIEKWTKIFLYLKSNEILNTKEFLEQNQVTTLSYKNQIIAMHLLSEFKLNEIDLHPYFSNLPKEFFDFLNTRNIKTIQTLQYLYVDESWSASKTLINFGAIIGALSLKNRANSNQSISLTLARKDIASATIAKKFGFIELSQICKHNVPVGLLVCFDEQPFPQEEVNQWADYYWKNKEINLILENTKQNINLRTSEAA